MIRTISAFALASALILAAAVAGPSLAGGTDPDGKPTFLISARDGYGVAECLTRGDACSVQVANAWCVAQGYHHASDLRVMEAKDSRTLTDAIAITCDH
ncbi:hypothetical protein ACUSIJ_17365 [Pseudochelatococcus sp. B33]